MIIALVIPVNQMTNGQPNTLNCKKSADQPTDSVQMNTASYPLGGSLLLLSTTHIYKETFACTRPNDPPGSVYLYKDLTTYTKVIGRSDIDTFFPTLTQFFTSSCIRNSTGDYTTCTSQDNTGSPDLTRCAEETPSPSIEMNTLTYDKPFGPEPGPQLRTIVSETHTYKCNAGNATIPNKTKEVVIFTYTYRDLGDFMIMMTTCVKDIKTAKVDYCKSIS